MKAEVPGKLIFRGRQKVLSGNLVLRGSTFE